MSNIIRDDREKGQPVTDPDRQRLATAVRWVDLMNLSAREFNRGYQGCAIEAGTIAKAVSGNANAIEKLKAACEELRLLQVEKDQVFDKVNALLTDETLTEGAEHSIKDLLYELSVRVKPRLRPALRKVPKRAMYCGSRCDRNSLWQRPAQVRLRVYRSSPMSWVRYWFSQGDWPKAPRLARRSTSRP